MPDWEVLGFGLSLVGSSDHGTTGKASRETASESVIAAKTSGHGMQHRNCSSKGTPIWMGIKMGRHVSHLGEGFTGSALLITLQHSHLLAMPVKTFLRLIFSVIAVTTQSTKLLLINGMGKLDQEW